MAKTRLPTAGDVVTNAANGERRRVKWVNGGHIQYEGGSSCSTRNFPMFYSECDVERAA